MQANERYCPKCGALNGKANAKPASDGSKKAMPVRTKPSATSVPERQPKQPVASATQRKPQPPVASATQRKPQPPVASATQSKPKPPVTSVTQGQPQPSATSVKPKTEKQKNEKSKNENQKNENQKNENQKNGKKKPSGCLKAFLIILAIGLVLGLAGIFLFGKFLPGGSIGNSDNQQIQAEYIEPEASTPLRKSLGGTYMPDEKDFRFDDHVSGYVDHVILVFFESGVSDKEVQRVASLVNGELIGCIDAIDCFELRVAESGREALDKVCEKLLREKSVVRACTDSVDQSASIQWNDPDLDEVLPNDPWGEWTWIPQGIRNFLFPLWSMIFPGGKNWHQELIGAPSAWAYTDYYSHVTVGVIDGGFDTEHPDLQITVVNPFANNQTLDDKKMAKEYNHGTHVAGIIGATRGNGKGINGILSGPYSLYGFCDNKMNVQSLNLKASVMLLSQKDCRVINRSIAKNWRKMEDSKGVEHYAINDKNQPFNPDTGKEYSKEVWFRVGVEVAKDVLVLLRAFGPEFLIVNAAGNDCIDAKYAGWVCSVTEDCAKLAIEEMSETKYTADDIMNAIIVVGAVAENTDYGAFERDLELANFSNYGDQVTICAPGDYIYSTVRNGYYSYPGTSMAAPIVAACAAQIWSVDLEQTPEQVKEKLVSTAVDSAMTVSSFDSKGRAYPVVNLKNAVESLLLEKGLITETRLDGDLGKLFKKHTSERYNIEMEEELQSIMQERLKNEFMNNDFVAAFSTLGEMWGIWFETVGDIVMFTIDRIVQIFCCDFWGKFMQIILGPIFPLFNFVMKHIGN